MSMAEPFTPDPEQPDTAFDAHPDAPVPEEHGEPEEADQTLTSAGEAAERREEQEEGQDPLPRFHDHRRD